MNDDRAQTFPPSHVRHLGIDENGLGPRLGPLVVTGAWAEVTPRGKGLVEGTKTAPASLAARLGDSKRLVAFGDSALGEAWARVILGRQGIAPTSPDTLFHALCIDGPTTLQAHCPSRHSSQCWNTEGEAFEASAEVVDAVDRDVTLLASRGISLRGARLVAVCTERLNVASKAGISRFDVDLHAMERIALDIRGSAGVDLQVTCGKVGGIDRYATRFGPLAGFPTTTIEEGRAKSSYRIAGLGDLSFVRDADDAHMLVSLASLIGKWARDFLMTRIVRYHRALDPTLDVVSGYHDPVTARFVSATALARKTRGLPDTCFERLKAGQ